MSFTKWHGGGGHTKAAGVSVEVNIGDANAYDFLEQAVNKFEEENPLKARLHPCSICSKLGHRPQDHTE